MGCAGFSSSWSFVPSRTLALMQNYLHNMVSYYLFFPKEWKIAKTVPVHKSGKDRSLSTSYRPIAILCVLSKVFEKIINNNLVSHIENHNIIPNIQFGFRRGLSTSHALTLAHKTITSALTKSESVGAMSLDVEKAFDRVWHDGLIVKMIKCKFPSPMIAIVNSFLRDRHFVVNISSERSVTKSPMWGVPQGSALSPTLYNIYTSDLPHNDKETTTILYADDTLLLAKDHKINNISKRLTDGAYNLLDYCKKWKIKINTAKTELTLFTNRRTKQLPSAPLVLERDQIHWGNELKYLGFTFDRRMTFHSHILKTTQKFDNAVRLLRPLINSKSVLSANIKLMIYKTYLRPLLTYGAPILKHIAHTNTVKLCTRQNKHLRMTLNIPWDLYASNAEIGQQYSIPPLADYIDRLCINFVNHCINSEKMFVKSLINV